MNESTGKAAIAQLTKMGFSDAIIEEPRRLVVSVSGQQKCGKTHFSLTAPDPIFFFNIDIGTEGVMGKFQKAGKKIYNKDIRVHKGEKKETYEALWSDFVSSLTMVCKVGEGTIVVDTASELYELARLSYFGKLSEVKPHHYGELNALWREMMRTVYDSPMNAVFIHKVKPIWENNQKTRNFEVAGFSDTGYMVQMNLTALKDRGDDGINFSVLIGDCRKNLKALEGMVLKDEMCTFDFLLGLVHD